MGVPGSCPRTPASLVTAFYWAQSLGIMAELATIGARNCQPFLNGGQEPAVFDGASTVRLPRQAGDNREDSWLNSEKTSVPPTAAGEPDSAAAEWSSRHSAAVRAFHTFYWDRAAQGYAPIRYNPNPAEPWSFVSEPRGSQTSNAMALALGTDGSFNLRTFVSLSIKRRSILRIAQ